MVGTDQAFDLAGAVGADQGEPGIGGADIGDQGGRGPVFRHGRVQSVQEEAFRQL